MEASQVEATLSPFIQKFARFGYASKGVVYLLVGLLAVAAASGSDRAKGPRESLSWLRGEPLGRVALAVIALGLFGYVGWRAYMAIRNPENRKPGSRLVAAGTAIGNAGIAATAARLAAKGGSASGNQAAVEWTARLMEQPAGRTLAVLVGIGIAGYGLAQLVRAFRSKLDRRLDLAELDPPIRRRVVAISRTGIGSRGIVFLVIGYFVAKAGIARNAGEARDVGGALKEVELLPAGPWLLAFIAVGLLAYGVYELTRARYRRIRTH